MHTCLNIHMIVQWYVDLHVLVLINDRYAKVASITEIVMKVKVQGHGEAGWLVKVTEVTEDEPQQLHFCVQNSIIRCYSGVQYLAWRVFNGYERSTKLRILHACGPHKICP